MSDDLPAHTGIVRRIFGNLGFLLGGRAAAGLLSIVYMVIAARTLAPAGYGVLILVHGYIMAVGALVSISGWHVAIRLGSKPMQDGDHEGVIRIMRFASSIELAAGVLAIIVAASLAPIIGPMLGWSADAQTFAIPYSLAVLASVRATPAGFLQLARRFDLLAVHSLVAPLVRLVGALIVAILGLGLKGFLLAWLIAALAEWAAMWIFAWVVARQHYPDTQLLGRPENIARETPGLWRFMLAANADLTLSDLAPKIVPLAIGWILGPAAAGLFSIAQRATAVLSQPGQFLGQAAYSEFASLVASGRYGRRLRSALWRCAGIAFATATPVVVILAFFSRDIAVLLGGQQFGDAAPVMIWLAVARLFLLTGPSFSAALIALGRPALSVAANVGSNLLTLPLLLPLLSFFGLNGAGAQALAQAALAAGFLWGFLHVASKSQMPETVPAYNPEPG